MITTDPVALPLQRPAFADLDGMSIEWAAAPVAEPSLVVLDEALATELGLDADALRTPAGVTALIGQQLPEGAVTIAQAYAGHQFGNLSPRLGDGRALLLGELSGTDGRRVDVHLKGSGATPFSRGGDGKAALGPMLREHLVSSAMHALGIPTTRALAVVATGEPVLRETPLPGAILVRVAASHLRVGSFQYAAAIGGTPLLQQLADLAIARHHPQAAEADQPYVALFEAVVEAQASLVARWMAVGFIHGVMNTDNMTISGETIDYGPCAFMDTYDPATVFSSIDHGGRYAYGNQPRIAHWNLARLGEAMLPLFAAEPRAAIDAANGVLAAFADRYEHHRLAAFGAKLGLAAPGPDDAELIDDLLAVLEAQHLDMTSTFRALGDDVTAFMPNDWTERWRARRDVRPTELDRVNPIYIPRNHLVEEALAAATESDMAPYELLLDAVTHPFDAHAGRERYAEPGPADPRYRTFCGT
ncbi:MAG: YdiU family protein [Ilumatobacteraceae bacterium]